MHKLQLVCIVTMVGLSTFLQSAVGADGHFDNLNNKILRAEHEVIFDNVVKIFREKCKIAAEGVEKSTIYQDFVNGATELTTCITAAANVAAEKIKKARFFCDLDTIGNKQCNDRIKCSLDFNEKVQPCLSATEREHNAVAMRIVKSVGDYMCSKGGLHVVRDIEEGVKCLATKQDAINACFHNSFPDIKMPKLLDFFGDLVMEPSPYTEWDQQQMQKLLDYVDLVTEASLCTEWEHFQSCTLQQLKRCREKTPASVAETVFKIIKREGPCKQNGAGTAPINAVSLMLTSGVMFLVCRLLKM